MSNKNDISCIIVAYNSHNFVKKCLESLSKGSMIPEEIIIIDNKSKVSPRSIIENLKNKKINIKLVENDKNLGFAKAVNLGVGLSSKDNILLLNPDFFTDKNAVLNLYTFKKGRNIIAGGKTYCRGKSKIQKTVTNKLSIKIPLIEFTSFSKILDWIGLTSLNNFWNEEVLAAKQAKEVAMVSGCFMLFDKKTFKKINGFDEKFFLYLEDLDFCLRAKEKGIKTFFVPNATGEHIQGGSSLYKKHRINKAYWDQSKRHFTKKYFKRIGKFFCLMYDFDDIIIKLKKTIIR